VGKKKKRKKVIFRWPIGNEIESEIRDTSKTSAVDVGFKRTISDRLG
jgi:hypothetical protein